jgi:hypothetical protein
VARKGLIKVHHFAHKSGSECSGLAEGVLHRLAKELLCSLKRFYVPAYFWSRRRKLPRGRVLEHRCTLTKAGVIRVVHGVAEHRIPADFVPDVILLAGSANREPEPLIIEVVVSNPISALKRRKIRRYGTPVLVISLEPRDGLLTPEEMRAKLEGDSKAKQWCFHPRQIEPELAFIKEYRHQWRKDLGFCKPKIPTRLRLFRPRADGDSYPVTSMQAFLKSERVVREFYEKHKRWPTLDEIRSGVLER